MGLLNLSSRTLCFQKIHAFTEEVSKTKKLDGAFPVELP